MDWITLRADLARAYPTISDVIGKTRARLDGDHCLVKVQDTRWIPWLQAQFAVQVQRELRSVLHRTVTVEFVP